MYIYYVYAYLRNKDSATAKAGTPYYIGKGKKNRINEKHNVSVPIDKSKIIFLETGLSDLGAMALERRMIRWWGRKDLATGILHNKTDGGDGLGNPSKATREKIRAARKLQVITHSDKTKARMSAVSKGKPKSDKHKEKTIINLKNWTGLRHSEETKQKMRKPKSKEHKKNMSIARLGTLLSDEHKKKLSSAKVNASVFTCKHCGKLAKASMLARWHNDNCKFKQPLIILD